MATAKKTGQLKPIESRMRRIAVSRSCRSWATVSGVNIASGALGRRDIRLGVLTVIWSMSGWISIGRIGSGSRKPGSRQCRSALISWCILAIGWCVGTKTLETGIDGELVSRCGRGMLKRISGTSHLGNCPRASLPNPAWNFAASDVLQFRGSKVR